MCHPCKNPTLSLMMAGHVLQEYFFPKEDDKQKQQWVKSVVATNSGKHSRKGSAGSNVTADMDLGTLGSPTAADASDLDRLGSGGSEGLGSAGR